MNLNTQLEWLIKNGKKAIRFPFKIRTIPLICLVLFGQIPFSYIYDQPLEIRLIWASAISIFSLASAPYITNVISPTILGIVMPIIKRNKYQTQLYSTPEIEELANRMGLVNKIKVHITNNPWIEGPFCNMLTGNVTIPVKWSHPEQEPLASVAHEFGHIKTRKTWFKEALIGQIIAGIIIYIFYFNKTLPNVCIMVSIVLQMLIFTVLSQRNEFRADEEGARYAGPEGLISLFEKIKYESKCDDDSETHPSLKRRIKRLYKLLE